MDTAAIGVTQKEDHEEDIDQQNIFSRMVLLLAAITLGLFNRVVGADDPPFRPIMGKRGDAGVAAGSAATGAGSSASRTTTVAASASETPEPLGQGRQGAGRGIAEGTQCGQQYGQEDVNPLIRFALAHAAQAALDHLEAVRLQVGEQEEQPVFRRRQGAVLLHAQPAGGPGFPREAPRGHPCLERRLEGRDEELKLVEG